MTGDEPWFPYDNADPTEVARLRNARVRRLNWLDRFAEEVRNAPVIFTPETGHPQFRTYHGATEDRLPSINHSAYVPEIAP